MLLEWVRVGETEREWTNYIANWLHTQCDGVAFSFTLKLWGFLFGSGTRDKRKANPYWFSHIIGFVEYLTYERFYALMKHSRTHTSRQCTGILRIIDHNAIVSKNMKISQFPLHNKHSRYFIRSRPTHKHTHTHISFIAYFIYVFLFLEIAERTAECAARSAENLQKTVNIAKENIVFVGLAKWKCTNRELLSLQTLLYFSKYVVYVIWSITNNK